MLDDKDIKKLTTILATKRDIVVVRKDIYNMRKILQEILVTSDRVLKSVLLTRHERRTKQLSEKLGVQLSFE